MEVAHIRNVDPTIFLLPTFVCMTRFYLTSPNSISSTVTDLGFSRYEFGPWKHLFYYRIFFIEAIIESCYRVSTKALKVTQKNIIACITYS
jgi:hypothetical protein